MASLNLLFNIPLFLFLLCKVTSMNNLNESNTGFSPEVLGIDDVSNLQIEEEKHVELHDLLFKPTMEGTFPEQVRMVHISIEGTFPELGRLVMDTGSDVTWSSCDDGVIGASQLFVMDLNAGMFCLAMRSSDYFTAIGNYQQRNTRFIYVLEANELTFYPERCRSLDSVGH